MIGSVQPKLCLHLAWPTSKGYSIRPCAAASFPSPSFSPESTRPCPPHCVFHFHTPLRRIHVMCGWGWMRMRMSSAVSFGAMNGCSFIQYLIPRSSVEWDWLAGWLTGSRTNRVHQIDDGLSSSPLITTSIVFVVLLLILLRLPLPGEWGRSK